MPAVSVLVTVFNGEDFLSLGLDSISRQNFSDFELVVVDDGSTDATPLQLEANSDPRLRVIRNQRNLGIPLSRNIAIDAAKGCYCAFLSHDDIALPERLARQVEFLEKNKAIGLIGSAIETIDAEGKSRGVTQMPETSTAIRWMGLLECPMRQSALIGRTEIVRQHIYDPRFPSYSDWDFVMRVARHSEVRNLPEVLVQYRRHRTNTSTVHRARLDEAGADIALREILRELPDFPITREQVWQLRSVLLGAGDRKKSLSTTREALECYLDLSDAFRKKHPDHITNVSEVPELK
ncbi:MAG: glycosyltransferase family 2 protein [Verrucomicrobiota bacterium]|nr:glycosyltransferase family 2 protein [Verrucomicrobiota bacterium]